MAPQFDRPLRDLLRAAGCIMVRQGKGSHEIWHSPVTGRNFAVPIGIPSRHTANAILRQAGLKSVLNDHAESVFISYGGDCADQGRTCLLQDAA